MGDFSSEPLIFDWNAAVNSGGLRVDGVGDSSALNTYATGGSNVYGSSTSNITPSGSSGGGGGGSTGPDILHEAAHEEGDSGPSYDEMFNQAIEVFQPLINDINNQIGQLPGQENQLLGDVDTSVGIQEGIIGNALTSGQNELANQTQEAKDTEKSTLTTLQEDVRNLFESGNQMLGSMGASDSSAAEMLKYAIAKQGNKRTADVVNTTRKILGEIKNLGVRLETETKDKLAQVQQWKLEQQQQVRMYIDGLRRQLLDARGNINATIGARQLDMIENAYTAAQNRMNQLHTASVQMEANIADEYRQRRANLEDFASQLAIQNRYQGSYANQYRGMQGMGGINTQSRTVVPGAPASDEKEKDTFSGLLG